MLTELDEMAPDEQADYMFSLKLFPGADASKAYSQSEIDSFLVEMKCGRIQPRDGGITPIWEVVDNATSIFFGATSIPELVSSFEALLDADKKYYGRWVIFLGAFERLLHGCSLARSEQEMVLWARCVLRYSAQWGMAMVARMGPKVIKTLRDFKQEKVTESTEKSEVSKADKRLVGWKKSLLSAWPNICKKSSPNRPTARETIQYLNKYDDEGYVIASSSFAELKWKTEAGNDAFVSLKTVQNTISDLLNDGSLKKLWCDFPPSIPP